MSICPGIADEQLKTTNGCGSSYWLVAWLRLPRWASHALYCLCGCHDIGYQDKTRVSRYHKAIKDRALVDGIYDSAYLGPVWQRWPKIMLAEVFWAFLNTEVSWWCYLAAKRGV